ncbi:MAG: hypothetical protein MJY66_09020 [Bacteroidaceae bacterium]|nr:hypothetical protein [Bacteroidaceae bacterium]
MINFTDVGDCDVLIPLPVVLTDGEKKCGNYQLVEIEHRLGKVAEHSTYDAVADTLCLIVTAVPATVELKTKLTLLTLTAVSGLVGLQFPGRHYTKD